ncbi:MAG: DUF4276 family protein [Candidatus Riflebacteria bacterium]|nr:DUF4276 family protein [Candidatus Riflebacteria bacterium]
MKLIVPIVEGQSEVESVPVLIRRLLGPAQSGTVAVRRPIRAKRNLIVKPGELERTLQLACRQPGCAGVLLLLDADDDCPATLGPALLRRMQAAHGDDPCRAVIAKAEFEAWFLASMQSLRGCRGIDASAARPDDPEAIRSAKAQVSRHMPNRYVEVEDQPALAAAFDLEEARTHSPSFDKFVRDMNSLVCSVVGRGES